MSRFLVVRALESFFRRWWLYLLPLVLLSGLGLYSVATTKAMYRAGGTINIASTTLLSTLSGVEDNANFGYDSPAASTSKQLGALLETEQFVTSIAASAGLEGAIAAGQTTLDEVRASISSSTAGTNLLKVAAVSMDPAVAPRLVTATIEQFTQLFVDSRIADSAAAESFYADLANQYQADVDQARNAVDAYVVDHPSPSPPLERPEEEILELTRLSSVLSKAEERYNGALSKSLDARLAIQQVTADIGQRLRLVDSPEGAFREGRFKKSAMTLATFVALGALLTIGTVVVGMILDRTVRTPEDVRERLGLKVLAVVPEAPLAQASTAPKASKAPKAVAERGESTSRGKRRGGKSAPEKLNGTSRKPVVTSSNGEDVSAESAALPAESAESATDDDRELVEAAADEEIESGHVEMRGGQR